MLTTEPQSLLWRYCPSFVLLSNSLLFLSFRRKRGGSILIQGIPCALRSSRRLPSFTEIFSTKRTSPGVVFEMSKYRDHVCAAGPAWSAELIHQSVHNQLACCATSNSQNMSYRLLLQRHLSADADLELSALPRGTSNQLWSDRKSTWSLALWSRSQMPKSCWVKLTLGECFRVQHPQQKSLDQLWHDY